MTRHAHNTLLDPTAAEHQIACDPDRIEPVPLAECQADQQPGLVEQIAEIAALRAEVGCLPVGTRISWRTEFDRTRRTGTIAARECEYAYRTDDGTCVLWKSHHVRVESLPVHVNPTGPDSARQVSITTAPTKETPPMAPKATHQPRPHSNGLTPDEIRAERIQVLDLYNQWSHEGVSVPERMRRLAAWPVDLAERCGRTAGKPLTKDIIRWWARQYSVPVFHTRGALPSTPSTPSTAPRGAAQAVRRAAALALALVDTGTDRVTAVMQTIEEHADEWPRYGLAAPDSDAVLARLDGALAERTAATTAATAAAPVQAACTPPAPALQTAGKSAALDQVSALVRAVIDALLDRRPVRYEHIARCAEIGTELDRQIADLYTLVAE